MIRSMVLEHFPRLQSVNVYIRYDESKQPPQFRLTERFVELQPTAAGDQDARQQRIAIPRELYVNARSISLFVHRPGTITFRACTNRADTFSEEFLCRTLNASLRLTDERKLERLRPTIAAGDLVRMCCSNCGHDLSCDGGAVRFERILELPSENIDSAEWFCRCSHKAGDNGHPDELLPTTEAEAANRPSSNAAKMQARSLDLLYGQYYFVVHADRLRDRVVIAEFRTVGDVCCSACTALLGQFYAHNDTVKLWNEAIAFVQADRGEQDSQCLFAGSLRSNFTRIVRTVIEDFDFLMSSVALPQTIRCLFECRSIDSADRVRFLFVHVMNAKLSVWRYDRDTSSDNGQADGKLQPDVYVKIMYRLIEQSPAVPVPPLVASWQTDSTVTVRELSDRMMSAAIDSCERNSRLVPECYRRAPMPEFQLSYLW